MTGPAFTDCGSGAPTLLFVHGYTCGKEDWDAQIPGLRDRFRCIALDLPGHGATPPGPEATVAALADAVNAVRAHVADPVILIGHSLGVKVIREACVRSPEGVSGLILIDGGFHRSDTDQVQSGVRLYVEANGFPAFVRDYFSAVPDNPGDMRLRDEAIRRAQGMDADFACGIYQSAVAFDANRSRQTLEALTCPVLVLQSSRIDASGRRVALQEGERSAFSELVQRHVPAARIVTIVGSGHFPMYDRAETVTEAIRAFALQVHANSFR
ncbi:alpha/beta fold hydrolase [Antarctobacter sp.]|uniref:alpha/beta fold hydrolase n=1 Tax=Antarctobacter sp. TaxID=1872577 RepID=UPI003A8E1764